MRPLLVAALFALCFATGFTCSKNTPPEASAPAATETPAASADPNAAAIQDPAAAAPSDAPAAPTEAGTPAQ